MNFFQNNSLDFSELKFGIYARVSNEKQVEDGWSLAFQEDLLKRFIKENNYNLISCKIEPGISGNKFSERMSLNELINDIENKKINCILLFRVDRLVRGMEVGVKIAKILQNNNCYIYSMEGCGLLDLNTPYGETKYYELVNISQSEVHTLSYRIAGGKKQRAKNGLYINSNSVYGYDPYYNQYTGKRILKVNDYESQIVEKIYEWNNADISEYQIAKKLREQEIPCKRGGKWKPSTIHSILTNVLYIGKVKYCGNKKEQNEIYEGVHQRIITDDIFYIAQEKIKKRKNLNIKKQPGKNSYFSSVLVCPNCGSQMIAKQVKAKDKNSIRYYCKNKCGQRSIKHTELDYEISNYFENNIDIGVDNKDILLYETNDKILTIQNKIKRYQKNINEMDYRFSENCIDYITYQKQLNIINQKILSLNKDREELIKNSKSLNRIDKEIIKLNFLSFSNLWNQISADDKKIFINTFIKKIYINIIDGIISISEIEFIKI